MVCVVRVDPSVVGVAVGVVMDDGMEEGVVVLESAPEFIMEGNLLQPTPFDLRLPPPKILRVFSILCLSPQPLYRLHLLLLLLPTACTHLRHRRLPLLSVAHRAQLLLRLPLLPLLIRSYEYVLVAVIEGGGGLAGFGDRDSATGTFKGSAMGGDEGVAAVDATAAGIFRWYSEGPEVGLASSSANGVLVAVAGLGVGERSPSAIAAERSTSLSGHGGVRTTGIRVKRKRRVRKRGTI